MAPKGRGGTAAKKSRKVEKIAKEVEREAAEKITSENHEKKIKLTKTPNAKDVATTEQQNETHTSGENVENDAAQKGLSTVLAPKMSNAVIFYAPEALPQKVAGPVNPYSDKPLIPALWKNHPQGRIEQVDSLTVAQFEAQRRAYDRSLTERRLQLQGKQIPVRNREPRGKASDLVGFKGPWAGFMGEEHIAVPSEAEVSKYLAKKEAAALPPAPEKIINLGEERSVFHGEAERDYLGRTYMHVPVDLDIKLDKEPGSFECFAPKKHIHTWMGHTKGVTAIRFFPHSGHLLLSASQDARVKLWDVHHDRQCLRTFMGHNKPVRDICFDGDGRHFVSAAYDQCVKHWDTETGQCVWAHHHEAIPFCVKIHPGLPHIVMAGCSDRRVVQWDMRSGDLIQEYAQHQEAVNTVTFIDNNRRFVTTSDDKTIRVWDYDIPVTAKYIAEPDMHSMPAAGLHPSGTAIVMQSLNNQLITYACGEEKFQQRGRKYGGHSTGGFACGIDFSPDGHFLISGDARGQLIVWDFKTGQIVRRHEGAHAKVCIDAKWNPQEPSRVATCSWDGTIKYWD